MIRKRYVDTAKLITDIEKFELTGAGEILIYCGDKWYDEVTVNLEGQEEKFEELKSIIAYPELFTTLPRMWLKATQLLYFN